MIVNENPDGTLGITLDRAEAHVIIWGGRGQVLTELRHRLVDIEDALSEEQYGKIMEDVGVLPDRSEFMQERIKREGMSESVA